MRTVLVYLHVVGKSDANAPEPIYYVPFQQRFVATYKQHKPTVEHELIVCCCGNGDVYRIDEVENMYKGVATGFTDYFGSGWDIGAHQDVASRLDADFMVFLATPVYFWRADWLQKMVDAFNHEDIDGLYGPMASYEHAPHIRTSCFGCSPQRFRQYPHNIDSRERARFFETTDWNFSRWFKEQGLPVKMVTADGCYDEPDWRTPANIFRRGDQSNVLVRDRHVDVYSLASPEEKQKLADAADGK